MTKASAPQQLSPTPTSIQSSDWKYSRGSSSPNRAWWTEELVQIQMDLQRKESENALLRKAVMGWKALAQQNERACREAQDRLRERERILQAELEALKKMHVKQVDEAAETIRELSNRIEQLQSNGHSTNEPDPCAVAEESYKRAASQVLERSKTEAVLCEISDMIKAIEEGLACFQQGNSANDAKDDEEELSSLDDEPTSSDSPVNSDITENNKQVTRPQQAMQTLVKKASSVLLGGSNKKTAPLESPRRARRRPFSTIFPSAFQTNEELKEQRRYSITVSHSTPPQLSAPTAARQQGSMLLHHYQQRYPDPLNVMPNRTSEGQWKISRRR